MNDSSPISNNNNSNSSNSNSITGVSSSPQLNDGEDQVSTMIQKDIAQDSSSSSSSDDNDYDDDNDDDNTEKNKEWNTKEFEQEYNEQDLKRIAESLAPRVTSLLDSNEAALEEMLAQDEELWMNHDDSKSNIRNGYSDEEDEDEEDDGLEHLRQELEASNDWGRGVVLLDQPSLSPSSSQSSFPNTADRTIQQDKISSTPLSFSPTNSSIDSSAPSDTDVQQQQEETNKSQTYTVYDHAKHINLQFDDADLGYPTCPLLTTQHAQVFLESLDVETDDGRDTLDDPPKTQHPVLSPKSRKHMIQRILLCNKEYIKPMSNDCLSRIYEGISGLSSSQYPWYDQDVKKPRNKRQINHPADISIKDAHGKPIHGKSEILPVRTISIQIRPDVLCGAVMDAVYSALHSMDAEVTKRQGGHLRALVLGSWIPEPTYSHFKPFGANQGHGMAQMFGSPTLLPQLMSDGMVFVPPFVVDAQLCVKRSSRTADRILVTRIYPISPGQILDDGIICPDTSCEKPSNSTTEHASSSHESSIDNDGDNWNLREASSLFQRMRDVAKTGGTLGFNDDHLSDVHDYESNPYSTPKQTSVIRNVLTSPLRLFSPSKPTNTPKRNKPALNFVRFDSEDNVIKGVDSARSLVTEKLISQFTVTPSIQEDIIDIEPIPSLSFVDWPYIQSSWRFVTSCLNELESRNLAYSTLISCPFGAFPSLPTLDVHYCSQMKAVSRQYMISSLLKSAQELEVFARESEYLCAKLIKTLEPTFIAYDEEPPQVPKAIPVSEYPLDFTPHEEISPPWGQKVIEALNLVAATASDSSSSAGVLSQYDAKAAFKKAQKAVLLVLSAFQKQCDEELSARIGRKNLQVMDRLAKMQAYKRQSIMNIRAAYGINVIATEAAEKLHQFVADYVTASSDSISGQTSLEQLPASEQVPLLTCRVLLHGTSGICYISYKEIVIVSQGIVGAHQIYHAFLNNIFVRVQSNGKKSRLNPVPSVLEIIRKTDGEQLFSFRPSIGARAMQDFIKTLSDVAAQKQAEIDFSKDGGLINMYDQKKHVAEAALADPEVSGV